MFNYKKILLVLSLVAALTLSACGKEKPAEDNAGNVVETPSEMAVESQDDNFGITDDSSVEDLIKILKDTIAEESEDRDAEKFTLIDLALKNAGLFEIKNTYKEDEIKDLYKDSEADIYDISNVVTLNKLGIISDEDANAILENEEIDIELAKNITIKSLEINNSLEIAKEQIEENEVLGITNAFLGTTFDQDIYAKLANTWKLFDLFNEKDLVQLGTKSILNKAATGYSIKSDKYDIEKNEDLSILYGHSNLNHAKQLIALLKINNINAKVGLEPKTSSYEYDLEWGPVPEPSSTYEVVKINDDFYLASDLEFELALEFENAEDKAEFDKLINTYAKKNKGNEDAVGLIAGSWWVPLYLSETEMGEGYTKVINNEFKIDEVEGYRIQSFVNEEDSEKQIEEFSKINEDVKVETKSIWVDNAFHGYLNGEKE